MIPHRSTALLTIIVFVALLLIIFSSSPATNSAVSGPARFVPHPKLPSFNDLHLPSFRPTVHTPPEPQPNSTSGETSWFSDWSWINPFSSSITLDENRSVLPPLRDRPFIYTYYEPNKGNDVEENNADAQLLLAWRRAWYAQGFRPVILGRGEAMNNQFYELVQRVKFKPELESEILRWLAWGHMGDGLLADWHCFPMARYDDALLSSLRRGSDPAFITRFDRLGGALYSGEKSHINEVIKQALNKVDETSTSLVGLASTDLFKLERADSLALYDSSTITSHYPTIAEKIVSSPTAGRLALAELINSHLHNTFQNAFPAGIAILKPFPKHTTALVEPALRLAKALVQCPSSPVPQSCPPNLLKCHPCDPAKPMQLSQPATYRNTTRVFTVGTLPHPFTLISLQQDSTDVSIRHIRRETDRDVWLTEVTKDQLGLEIGGLPRSTVFKRAVADDAVVGTSLWMTVESLPSHAGQSLPTELLDEFEWQFGFKIPRDGKVDAKNEDEKKESVQHATPSEQGVPKEYEIIQQAREIIKAQKPNNRPNPKAAAEAWNLADSEVWRFVRAYRARSVVERKKWEEDEKDFVGAQLKQ
ncbi:hypothetical protein ASPACDRAFT_112570 [Aspergillus aculeatus ATCC 16872]|uniref:Uncharacterized protein n=1 Tax=Aspergillus aculeatus (strain ATCC 16872 / CBS 172.66 / WB 5094) TaxID=690307 RepID=A0A1L9X6U4_ASPA1|nr:uncharacterized protein ASPACDRAFT_112570 [Aspergillus aculeatus ATCC 16872]OJK04183.1 hypothetical protein ASPACDRAFT_112570 [Aspergillus aculeatus ATCC 16872]